jgi:SAM-dependent methyltransferase
MADVRDHWERVYSSKSETEVSWYQRHSERSLAYIVRAVDPADPVIDVGGGASTLVDDLLARGFADITVLDVAAAALARAKTRLGDDAARVSWIAADITVWQPPRRYRLWHDRAVFHFLTGHREQAAYIAALLAGTGPGSTIVISTFAPDGPEKCSGLPVRRYSPQTLAARLGGPFALADSGQENHRTPWNAEQRFSYTVFRRTD